MLTVISGLRDIFSWSFAVSHAHNVFINKRKFFVKGERERQTWLLHREYYLIESALDNEEIPKAKTLAASVGSVNKDTAADDLKDLLQMAALKDVKCNKLSAKDGGILRFMSDGV